MFLKDAKRMGCALILGAGFAAVGLAQTAPGKPAVKAPATKAADKAADNKTMTLGGKDGGKEGGKDAGGKLLTRDELRACLKQRDTLAARLSQLDGERTKSNQERDALTQEQVALKTERESLAGMKSAVDELNAKTKVFQQEIDTWNKVVAEFTESKLSGSSAERQRLAINEQGESLRKRQLELNNERNAVLARGEGQVKEFNARATAIDVKVADWNERNRKLNGDGEALQFERQTWTADCGDKRYREDDEKAILSGK